MKIILDAGHGLNTPGKRVPDGSMKEYEFNRAVANYAKLSLLEYEGVSVLFTHSDAKDVPLSERCNTANKWGADVYVSIHANGFGNGFNSAEGIETYALNRNLKESMKLAEAIQSELIAETGRRNRGVKTANFQVLRDTKMTAVLAECGFMTNANEAALLKTEDYRKKCAKAIVDALVKVYGLKLKQAPKPVEKPKSNGNTLYKVQVGAFSSRENAEAFAKKVASEGFKTFIVEEA
jgi:N-acetylmuramoyl-L-alanine amidase